MDTNDPVRVVRNVIFGVVSVILIGSLFWGSWFVVDPSERAGVRYLGTVTTKEPLGPGLHFKLPIISSVDEIQVSQTTLHVEPFVVNTVDNQRIMLEINIAYTIPNEAVFHLLYEVGKTGTSQINSSIVPIIQDRVGRIISSKNTNFISAEREQIQNEVTASVHDALNTLFKINVASLQIAKIQYSDAFNQSNDRAVLAKNEAVAEENKKKVVEYQAQQRVIQAEGLAKEAIAQAEGQSRSAQIAAEGQAKALLFRAEAEKTAAILKAEAEKTRLELQGRGESARLNYEITVLGGSANYIDYQKALAQKNWNGSVPSSIMNTGNTPMLFTMPGQK